jgi:SAM-dependent methyltransferase
MTGYALRARFYRSEFTTTDDFPALTRLLAGDSGLVIDIPSGAGRLLPVHQQHGRDVIMVDIEPAMVRQCQAAARSRGLTPRVTAVRGDMRTWLPPRPADWIIIARGGLQLLPSAADVGQALAVAAANLAPGGLVYLDVAMPWTAADAAGPDLPAFMRFAGNTELRGGDTFAAGDRTWIRRTYASTLLPDCVDSRFPYQASGPAVGWQDFTARVRWSRLDADVLLTACKQNGLSPVAANGDYSGGAYHDGSARFICIAAAR